MQEEIMRLIELQKIDLEILKIEKAINEVPQSLQKAQTNKENLTKKLQDIEALIEEKKKQKDLFEEELKEEYQKLKSTQARLIQIRGTREYQLLLREIEEIKKANKQKEEEILKLMEEIETLEKERDSIKEALNQAEEVFNQEKEKFDAFCAEMSSNKEELVKKREGLAEKIPSNLLRKYELLRQRKGGIGIAPVINQVCEGCHMAIPPQLYNELQKDNRYYECPHCKRLIFYKRIYMPEEETQVEDKSKEKKS